MSPVSAFPSQPRECPPPPTIEVQKQTLLDYLAAFGLASQLTQEERLQFIEVDQQSLVSVSGSKYSVPSPYRLSEVEIDRREGFVRVFDPANGLEIAAHAESASPGAIVTNAGHYGDRAVASEALRGELLARLPGDPDWAAFVEGIWIGYRRYFREHAARLARLFASPPDSAILGQALAFCLERGLSAAQDLLDAYTARGGVLAAPKLPSMAAVKTAKEGTRELPIVEKRPLADYQRAHDAAGKREGGEA